MRCERLTLPPGVTLYYVIVDMLAEKDTTVILSELSKPPKRFIFYSRYGKLS